MDKRLTSLLFGLLFLFAGCATNPHTSVLGNWQPPHNDDGSLEFLEDGKLVYHMKFKTDTSHNHFQQHLSEDDIKRVQPDIIFADVEVPGSWKFINKSDIVHTLEFSNETMIFTNSIVQISDNSLIMNINGTNTTYSRIK